MKIFVSAKPGAKENKVEMLDDTHFRVSVKEPPIQGRANRAIIKLLAGYFEVPISRIVIVQGMFAREKVIDIVKK